MAGMRIVRTALLVALGCLPLTACGGADAGDVSAASIATFEVQPRDLEVTITEDGSLKATRQVLIRPRIPGQAKIVSLIDEGARVAEGDVLCELDRTERLRELEEVENRVIVLEGEVKAAEAELSIQLSENEGDLSEAELNLKFAKVELERLEKGEFVQEQKKLEVRVEEARSELARAVSKFETMPALLEEGFVTEDQVEEERIRKVKAESELELALLDQQTYLTYTYPKELARKQADVRNAEMEIDRTQERAEAREAQKRASLDRKRTELANAVERRDTVKEILQHMVVRAPSPGLVIYGDGRRGRDEREIKVGETVYSGQPFLTLPDLSDMQVQISVHEADIARVQEGRPAFVRLETHRGKVLEGTVTRVAHVAASRGRRWYDNTKRFEVEISLTGDVADLGLKPGLSAKVDVLVERLEGVLAVPAQAVFSQDGKFHVFVRSATGVERRQVEISDGNAQFVVVDSGIEPGTEVLLYNPETTKEAAPQLGPNDGGKGEGRP